MIRKPILCACKDAGTKQVLVGRVGGVLRSQFQERLSMINEIDTLLIPHPSSEVTASDQELFAQYSGKIIYTGPIVRLQERTSGESLRHKLGLTDEHKVILLTLGGGGWKLANDLMKNLLTAKTQILEKYPQARLIAIVGPHFDGELPQIDDFVCYASRFEPCITDYLNVASAVVCMGGYNTVYEVATTGLPAVSVPTTETDDFDGRTASYAQRFSHMVQGTAEPEVLAHEVINVLARGRDLASVEVFWQQARAAAQHMTDEIRYLLDA